jgi:esterase/lipase superfamily enzyme
MAYERLSNNLENASERCEELARNFQHAQSKNADELSSADLGRLGSYRKKEFRDAWMDFSITQLLLIVGGRLCETAELRDNCFSLAFETERLVALFKTLEQLDPAILYALSRRPEIKETIDELLNHLEALRDAYQRLRRQLLPFFQHPKPLPLRDMMAWGPDPYQSPNEIAATVMKVFYATDRQQNLGGNANLATFKDGRGHETLTYGMAEVSLPPYHRIGWLERLSLFEFRATDKNTRINVVVTRSTVSPLEEWADAVRERQGILGKSDILLFIHGFKNSFDDALKRAAQLSNDLQFDGVMAVFSWGSENSASLAGYTADMDNADFSVDALTRFLTTLKTQFPEAKIHIIAHSMGNRVLVKALQSISETDATHINEVVMAAPDVDSGHLRAALAAMSTKARRYTLYASSADLALVLSARLRSRRKKYHRAGQGGRHVFVARGVDTVEGSRAVKALWSMNHDDVFEKERMLTDLHFVIRQPTPVEDRFGLLKTPFGELHFWRIRGPR